MSYVSGYETGLSISRGLVSGHSVFHKHGRNTAVGTTAENISQVGDATPYMPTAAVNVEVVTTGNDTAAGTGARAVTIVGLNASFVLTTEVVATNAGTATSSGTFIRVFSAYVSSAGTYGGNNANDITIRAATAGTTFLLIPAGIGRSLTAHYCVPSGYSLYIKNIHFSIESGKVVTMCIWERENADDVTAAYTPAILHACYDGLAGGIPIDHWPYVKYPAKTDIWYTGVVTSGTASVAVSYTGILIAE